MGIDLLCPVCKNPKEMIPTMKEAMGESFFCELCKHNIDYDYSHGKIYIDGLRKEEFDVQE